MDPLRLSAALLLLAFAAPSSANAAPARRDAGSIEELKGDIGRPEDFQRFVEGSRERLGGLEDPRGDGLRAGRGAEAPFRLNPPRAARRSEGPTIPAASAAPSAARAEAPFFQGLATTNLPVRKLAAVLGLGFMLIAASMLAPLVETEPAPQAHVEPAPRPRPSPLRPPEPAPFRVADAPAEPAYIDARMPVSSWRAISWREQKLIEAWDSSPEKSLGLASLPEWLDARGGDGVDVPLLKAKLFRDA